MKSISHHAIAEIIINKSRFIARVFRITSLDEAMKTITEIRQNEPEASHHCYAYVFGDGGEQQRFDDDHEPSRTAGLPLLSVLQKNELTDVLLVVTRYFGGIKLGAGGLSRAYAQAARTVLQGLELCEKKSWARCDIVVSYAMEKTLSHLLKEHCHIHHTDYSDAIKVHVDIQNEFLPDIQEQLNERTAGKAQIIVHGIERRY
ncbi:MAG: YigZ family protein [Candidatus Izemoplasmatales bacterium]|nr:YigZ family protein [Candidatus Izemoplasmatales bacterium]MDD5293615.1 YigZ family protein [Candidatus Izemoplasmatales bacterium]